MISNGMMDLEREICPQLNLNKSRSVNGSQNGHFVCPALSPAGD
jgi:hypothetical protein